MDFFNVQDAKEALERMRTKMNWDPLRERCQRRLGWSLDYTRHILENYQCYLALKVCTGDWDATILSPPIPIDAMWHEHILDTKRYAEDCIIITKNRFFHHDADGDLNIMERWERISVTKHVYHLLFHEGCDLDTAATRELWNDFGHTGDDKHNKNTGASMPSVDTGTPVHPLRPRTLFTSTATDFAATSNDPSSSSESTEPSTDEDKNSSEAAEAGYTEDGWGTADSSRDNPDEDEQRDEEYHLINMPDESTRPNPITISVFDWRSAQTFYKLKRTTKMKHVFNNYAKLRGVNTNTLKFSTNGIPIDANDTPEILQLVDGETIRCDGVPITPPRLILRVREPNGGDIYFRIKATMRMHKMFAVMAQSIGVPAWRLTFFYGRIRIGQTDTAESLRMEDHACVDCRLDPLGC